MLNEKIPCYQCLTPVNYLFADSRCGKCTRVDDEGNLVDDEKDFEDEEESLEIVENSKILPSVKSD